MSSAGVAVGFRPCLCGRERANVRQPSSKGSRVAPRGKTSCILLAKSSWRAHTRRSDASKGSAPVNIENERLVSSMYHVHIYGKIRTILFGKLDFDDYDNKIMRVHDVMVVCLAK